MRTVNIYVIMLLFAIWVVSTCIGPTLVLTIDLVIVVL